MIPGRISWSAVREWADYHDLNADEFDFLDSCVRAMDDTYLQFRAARAKASQGNAK